MLIDSFLEFSTNVDGQGMSLDLRGNNFSKEFNEGGGSLPFRPEGTDKRLDFVSVWLLLIQKAFVVIARRTTSFYWTKDVRGSFDMSRI